MNKSIALVLAVSTIFDLAAIPAALVIADKMHGSAQLSITTDPIVRPEPEMQYNPPPPAFDLTEADLEAPTAAETVIVVQRPLKAPSPGKQFTCGRWEESRVGGAYRFCEWK